MVSRRGFLTGMLALGAAPAIVRAESLMRIWVPPQRNVLTLDMMRAARDRLMQDRWTEPFYVAMHPSAEEAMRELMITGSATVIYRSEVVRHG